MLNMMGLFKPPKPIQPDEIPDSPANRRALLMLYSVDSWLPLLKLPPAYQAMGRTVAVQLLSILARMPAAPLTRLLTSISSMLSAGVNSASDEEFAEVVQRVLSGGDTTE